MNIKFPDVHVDLVGGDGNVFVIIGAVAKGLQRAGHAEGAADFKAAALNAGSYDEVLQLAMTTVNVE